MNQQQVKNLLLKIKPDVAPFTLLFTGKKSNKVFGLYKIERAEILIHNLNHKNDNEIIHTAIHEFAHHIRVTTEPHLKSAASHGPRFWKLLHELLRIAEKRALYNNPFLTVQELVNLTKRIKEEFLSKSGHLLRQFGIVLLEAKTLCEKHGLPFEDYITRVLGMPKNEVKNYMQMENMKVSPALGPERMKLLSSIGDEHIRHSAQEAMLQGKSFDEVKVDYKLKPVEEDPLKHLLMEKQRIEQSIQKMVANLDDINKQIGHVKKKKDLKEMIGKVEIKRQLF